MTSAWFTRFWDIMNYICCYLTVNLGRGVFFSFALLPVLMLFRKLPFFRNCFQRMILWGCFLWLPFIGGLRLFYETRFGVRGFLWWANLIYEHNIIGQVYFLVMLLYGGCLLNKRRRIKRFAAGQERLRDNIHICENPVTPFAAGLVSPKIIVPGVMVRQYSKEDLDTILFHERTHIRLGHLWCLFLWDILRVLLWPNVFLTFVTKVLKADLEEMCDRVTIQRSGRDACDYGLLLLQCVRLLCPLKIRKLSSESAAFAGEGGRNGYRDMRRRIQKIAGFREYRIRSMIFIFLTGLLVIGGGFLEIHEHSYARYTELEDITVFDDTGVNVILEDSERLRQAVTFDKKKVFVDTVKMRELLEECGSETEGIYIMFGGFMKQPGVGGGGDMVYTDVAELTGERVEIGYESNLDALAWVVKML